MATTRRFVVDGGHALRIARVLGELNRQLFLQPSGCKLDPERVIATLQGMTEGKLVPFAGGLRGRFVRTMSILIGGVPKHELVEQVKDVRRLRGRVESMVREWWFTTLAEPELATLINLSPADLGFVEKPSAAELLDPARLTEWSRVNLDEYVIEPCPAEVGPHLATQYKDQPKGENLWVAAKLTSDHYVVPGPHMFCVERRDSGELILDGGVWHNVDWARNYRWGIDERFVFSLRKVSSASAA